jgi:hypothetical protein
MLWYNSRKVGLFLCFKVPGFQILMLTFFLGCSINISVLHVGVEAESTLVSLGDTLRLSSEDVNDTSLPLANTWKATSVDDDGDEFVDEDALLDEDDLKRPVLPGGFLCFLFVLLQMCG